MQRTIWIAFTDLLFNVLSMIAFVLLLLLMILKTEDAVPAIEDLNKIIIRAEWDAESKDDIDLWVRDPTGQIVGYTRKNNNGMVLTYDDTGVNVDKVRDKEGNTETLAMNYEQVNIRQMIVGDYRVNLKLYKRHSESMEPITATVTVIVVRNSRQKVFERHEFLITGQQRTMAMFSVGPDNRVRYLPVAQMDFVK